MREAWKIALLAGALAAGVPRVQSQTVAVLIAPIISLKMAAQSSRGPTFNLSAPPKQSSTAASSTKQNASPHILAPDGPPPDVVNRKEFEDNAGDKAGKLLLRSVPTGADVFVNNLLVGQTPILIVIAPGAYKVEMRGGRDESGKASVGVMPKETSTVAIELKQRYPSNISLR
jgi:PEGA domain